MRSIRLMLVVLLVTAAGAGAAAAQAAATPEQEVKAVVDRLFNAMRAADSAAVHALFHPQARLQTTALRQGEPVLRTDSLEAFLRAVGTPRTEVWDERVSNLEVRTDGELATAWMDYAFYLDNRFSHCGVNALQLFRTKDQGWQIIQIIDTRRRECPRIPGARPAP
ncbi:MAG TPA: nuclear transport factor 2 family protein [Longimicrobium sp.]|nr:nuclear transport factor 2 family protein [Longimicrobium sp.]